MSTYTGVTNFQKQSVFGPPCIMSCCTFRNAYFWIMQRQLHDGPQQVLEAGSIGSHLDQTVPLCLCSSRHHNHQLQQSDRLPVRIQQPVNDRRWGQLSDARSLNQRCSIHITTIQCTRSTLRSHRDLLQTQLCLNTMVTNTCNSTTVYIKSAQHLIVMLRP